MPDAPWTTWRASPRPSVPAWCVPPSGCGRPATPRRSCRWAVRPPRCMREQLDGVTEVRAGVYMFGDLFQAEIGTHDLDEIALTVLTSVIGRGRGGCWWTPAGWRCRRTAAPRRRRRIMASGWCSTSPAGAATAMRSCGAPIRSTAWWRPIRRIRSICRSARRLRIAPNHTCMTAAAHDRYFVVEGERRSRGDLAPGERLVRRRHNLSLFICSKGPCLPELRSKRLGLLSGVFHPGLARARADRVCWTVLSGCRRRTVHRHGAATRWYLSLSDRPARRRTGCSARSGPASIPWLAWPVGWYGGAASRRGRSACGAGSSPPTPCWTPAFFGLHSPPLALAVMPGAAGADRVDNARFLEAAALGDLADGAVSGVDRLRDVPRPRASGGSIRLELHLAGMRIGSCRSSLAIVRARRYAVRRRRRC